MSVKKTILDMCRLSSLAYNSPLQIQKLFEEKNEETLNKLLINPIYIDSKMYNNDNSNIDSSNIDGQLYISKYKDDEGVIFFRGTESIQDWLTNLNIKRVEMNIENCKLKPLVHTGFLNQYITLENEINKTIKDLNIKTIHLTGHSQGASLASIASIKLHFLYPDLNIYCYTFGSPRVGNKVFSELFNKSVKKSYRFLNVLDPVTTLPTSWRYKHVNNSFWLYPDHMNNVRLSKCKRYCSIIRHGFFSLFGHYKKTLRCFHNIDNYYDYITGLNI